jgi:hypothetical protein
MALAEEGDVWMDDEEDEVFQEDEEEEDPFGYDMYTQGLPIVIRASPTYGGKGVLMGRAMGRGEDVWEEDPLFSWSIHPDPAVLTLLRMKKGVVRYSPCGTWLSFFPLSDGSACVAVMWTGKGTARRRCVMTRQSAGHTK